MTDKVKAVLAGKSRTQIEAAIDETMDIVMVIEAVVAFAVYFLLQYVSMMVADIYLAIIAVLALQTSNDLMRKRMKEEYGKEADSSKTVGSLEDKPN